MSKRRNVQASVWAWVLGGGWGSRGGWGVAPSVSVNMGQSSNTKRTELARLLGEQEAIVQAAKFKAARSLFKLKPATLLSY